MWLFTCRARALRDTFLANVKSAYCLGACDCRPESRLFSEAYALYLNSYLLCLATSSLQVWMEQQFNCKSSCVKCTTNHKIHALLAMLTVAPPGDGCVNVVGKGTSPRYISSGEPKVFFLFLFLVFKLIFSLNSLHPERIGFISPGVRKLTLTRLEIYRRKFWW